MPVPEVPLVTFRYDDTPSPLCLDCGSRECSREAAIEALRECEREVLHWKDQNAVRAYRDTMVKDTALALATCLKLAQEHNRDAL